MPAGLACLAKSALALRGQRGAGLQQGDGLLVNAKEDRRRASDGCLLVRIAQARMPEARGSTHSNGHPEGWPSLTPSSLSLCSSTVLAGLPAGAAELTTRFTRPGFVDREGPACELRAIESRNSGFGCLALRHLDK